MTYSESCYDICKKVNSEINADLGGGCPIEKAFLMSYLAQNQNLKSHVEIGIYKGMSLFPVVYSIQANGGKSYGIDPYTYEDAKEDDVPELISDTVDNFLQNVDFYNLYQNVIMYRETCGYGDSLKIIREPSQKAIRYFKKNNITIDLLHIDGNHDTKFVRQDFELYYDILAEGGFIVFDDINWESVNAVYKEAKEKLSLVFECEYFGILYKENSGYKDFVKIEKLNKRLTSIYDKLMSRKDKATDELPLITVGVLTYNQENYIQECLQSIVDQKGPFRCKVIIVDDKSTDSTNEVIQDFLANIPTSNHLQFEYIRNEENLGVIANFNKLINLIRDSECDYFTFCEGDDYYFTNNRLEKHLTLHQHNPELAFSFNKILLYFQETQKTEVYLPEYHDKRLSSEDLVKENKPGSLCASFFDAWVLNFIKDDMFQDMFSGDWMFNIFCSQYGDIGHISVPMSVYRKHSGGIWTGSKAAETYQTLATNIPKYNKYLNFVYDKDFQLIHNIYINALFLNNALPSYDVAVIDNIFPHPLSGFSYQEFTSILQNFDDSAVLSTALYACSLSKDPVENLIISYKRKFPEYSHRVFYLDRNMNFKTKLLYGIFLGTAYQDLLYWANKLSTPFVFTLYPGGMFFLDDPKCDAMLYEVFSSPWFRKVIVTQQVTYDYLIKKNFCREEDIEFIFGVVTDTKKIKKDYAGKKHFGINKETLDVCFVAHKYSEFGQDKGYDLFVEAAKELSKTHDDIVFHVVGPWDEDVLDVSEVKHIIFHGSQPPTWFNEFYKNIDIIVSANMNGILAAGAFDGFPTTSVTDASLCEVAMFCTDPLSLNQNRFEEGKEIVILEHSAEDIINKIEYYYNNPIELENLGKNGKAKSEEIYSFENQLLPRIGLLKNVIDTPWTPREPIAPPTPEISRILFRQRLRRLLSRVTPNLIKRIYRKSKRIWIKIRQI